MLKKRVEIITAKGFSIWLAGGGIQGGLAYGKTDDVGHRAVENVVTPNDFQATLMNQFGLNHEELLYLSSGQEQIITNKRPAHVVTDILS